MTTTARARPHPTHHPVATPSAPRRSSAPPAGPHVATRLPLRLDTGTARQVITVAAASGGSTTATLQRWRKTGGGWRPVGGPVFAYLGSNGVGTTSESMSRTPAGSFTLTQAFGRYGNPGTRLRYFATTPDDYWISSSGQTYNTHQRCASCGYDNGVNERLSGILPEYGQAVVIDYNTPNSPGGVRQGAGSAFFLHVAAGKPTEGCVSIPRAQLVAVMRWLDPAQHPRILIGVR